MELATLYVRMKRRQRAYRSRLLWPVWLLDFLEFIPLPGMVVWALFFTLVGYKHPEWSGISATLAAILGLGYLVTTRAVFWWWPLRRLGDFLEWYFLNREIEETISALTSEDCLGPQAEVYLRECVQMESECARLVRFYTLRLVGSSHKANTYRLEQFKLLHVRPFIHDPASALNTPEGG